MIIAPPINSISIFGVRVDDVSYVDTLMFADRCLSAGGHSTIATVNTEFVMAARGDAAFRELLNGCALNVPDGIGLMAAARFAGKPLREHVRGTDLTDQLCALASRKGYRVFFLGGRDQAGAEAAAALRRRWPGLRVAGWYEGEADAEHDEQTLVALQRAGRIDLIFVAYGAGRQEDWLRRNLARSGASLGVGGVFDFFAGRAPRAPRWVQRLELEWLHRLVTQPWRWRRQLVLPQFVALFLFSWLRHGGGSVGVWRRAMACGDHHQSESDDRKQGEPN